jgi:hypothetical protein
MQNVTIESLQALAHGFAGVSRRMRLNVTDNELTVGPTVWTYRKNGANGNQTISVATTLTGWFEDTTHTDSFTATDTCCFAFTFASSPDVIQRIIPDVIMTTETPSMVGSTAGTGVASGTGRATAAAAGSAATGVGVAAGTGVAIGAGAGISAGVGASVTVGQPTGFMRPGSDDLDGSWTTESGGTNLFNSIDEVVPNDADYIQSVIDPPSDTCRVNLVAPSGNISSPFVVTYRYSKSGTEGVQVDLTVTLKQGTTTIASWSHTNISTTLTTVRQTLTAPQLAAISDFTNLKLEFNANKP